VKYGDEIGNRGRLPNGGTLSDFLYVHGGADLKIRFGVMKAESSLTLLSGIR
jgi:hypothetical protein